MAKEKNVKRLIRRHVYNTILPVSIDPDEEENYRNAAKMVTDTVNRYAEVSNGKNSITSLLYMAMIDIALKYEQEKQKQDTDNLKNILTAITAEIEESLKKIGKTPEQIEKYLKDLEGYKERTKERQDVSSMIAHSGFGNTKLGRGAQKLLSARQQADDISNFGGYLKNGGAEKMSKSLFGNGAAAKGATKALGGLGSMLTKFAGPIAAVSLAFDLAKAAVETFVKMVNIANEYISRNIKQ